MGQIVIHPVYVDTRDARPHGHDRAEDEALPDRSHRRGMGVDRPAVADAREARAQAGRGDARGSERNPLHDPLRRRLAHAAEGLSAPGSSPGQALADGLLVVPTFRAADAVPDDPRHRADDGSRASGTGGQPVRRRARQPDGQGSGPRRKARVRCGQEDGGPQTPYRRGHRRSAADGQPDVSRHIRQRRRADDPGRGAQTLAVVQASVYRRRVRPHAAHGQGRLPGVRHRGGAPHRQRAGLQGPAAPLGRRTHLRLSHTMATPGCATTSSA